MKPNYTSYEVSNYEQSSRDFLHAFVVSLFQQLGDNSSQSLFVSQKTQKPHWTLDHASS
jgi:hypothetical protein